MKAKDGVKLELRLWKNWWIVLVALDFNEEDFAAKVCVKGKRRTQPSHSTLRFPTSTLKLRQLNVVLFTSLKDKVNIIEFPYWNEFELNKKSIEILKENIASHFCCILASYLIPRLRVVQIFGIKGLVWN